MAVPERAYTSHAEGRMPEQSQFRPEFNLRAQRDGDRLLIATAGELDLTTAPDLEAALLHGAPYTALELDLAGLTFIDSSGLRLLLSERDRAHREGSAFTIIGASGPVARVFAISGFDTELEPADVGFAHHEVPEREAPVGTGDRSSAA